MIRRAIELGQLVDELVDADWRHPSWWGVVAGTALIEAAGRDGVPPTELYATFLAANGSPRADTFMARPLAAPEPSAAERVAVAVVRARAAAESIAARADQLPGQPLGVAMRWERGWLRRAPLAIDPVRVAFATPRGCYLAALDGRDAMLAEALGAALAGRGAHALTRIDPDDRSQVPAAICVSLEQQPIDVARHLHRAAWTRGGGPWLGIGRTSSLELVTTCHLAVDGYGHAVITGDVFGAIDRAADARALAAAAARGLDGVDPPSSTAPPIAGAEPLGFAGAPLADVDELPFARFAYAFGRALERVYRADLPAERRRAARRSPTFQIPIAIGEREDADRLRRRFLIGLTSIRMRDGAFEPFARYRARLSEQIAREAHASGLLTRILRATASAPVPDAWRRRLLASRKTPSRWLPPIEALGGRGQLSSLRFLDGDAPPAPLYACSTPSLPASPADTRGSLVLTLVHHERTITASVVGTGLASTTGGARAILDVIREELAVTG